MSGTDAGAGRPDVLAGCGHGHTDEAVDVVIAVARSSAEPVVEGGRS